MMRIFSRIWPIMFILFIVLVFFYQILFLGKIALPADALVGAHVPWTEKVWDGYPAGVPIKNLEISDTFSQFYPWRMLVGQYWREFKVPLWNQYNFSGYPLLANVQSAGLYPLNILFLILDDFWVWNITVVLTVFFALLFTYFLLRNMNISKLASVFGAIIFSFSGFIIGWLEFSPRVHAGIWLPLLMTLALKYYKTKKLLWLTYSPFVFYFMYTAGDVQISIYSTLFYIMFSAYLLAEKRLIKPFFTTILFVFFGVLLSSIQLIPSLELYLNSIRVGDNYIQGFNYGMLSWYKLTNFFWPDFYGNVVTGNYWGGFTYHEYIGYVGIVALVFVLLTLFLKKDRLEKFMWISLFATLLFLLPNPIAYLPYKLNIPVLSTSFASRIIFLTDFILAIIASYGFDKWLKSNRFNVVNRTYYLVASSLFLLSMSVVVYMFLLKRGYIISSAFSSENAWISIRNIVVPTSLLLILISMNYLKTHMSNKNIQKIMPILVIVLLTIELFRYGWKNTPFSEKRFVFPNIEVTDFLKANIDDYRVTGKIPTNLTIPYQISAVDGYDPIYPKNYSYFVSAINNGNFDSPSGRYGLISNYASPLLNYASTKYIIDFKKDKFGGINKDGAFDTYLSENLDQIFAFGRVGVFENTKAYPRAWLADKFELLDDDSSVISKLIDDTDTKHLILENDISEKLENIEDSKITGFSEKHGRVVIHLENAKNTLLYLSNTYYPGWQVRVDDKSTEILRANFIHQAVFVPSGTKSVVFTYEPRSFSLGKNMTIATMLILITSITFQMKKRRSER